MQTYWRHYQKENEKNTKHNTYTRKQHRDCCVCRWEKQFNYNDSTPVATEWWPCVYRWARGIISNYDLGLTHALAIQSNTIIPSHSAHRSMIQMHTIDELNEINRPFCVHAERRGVYVCMCLHQFIFFIALLPVNALHISFSHCIFMKWKHHTMTIKVLWTSCFTMAEYPWI